MGEFLVYRGRPEDMDEWKGVFAQGTQPRSLAEMMKGADVVLDNFGADVLTRLGLGPEDLRAVKPDLIVLKMPGLGCEGPKHRWRRSPHRDAAAPGTGMDGGRTAARRLGGAGTWRAPDVCRAAGLAA